MQSLFLLIQPADNNNTNKLNYNELIADLLDLKQNGRAPNVVVAGRAISFSASNKL